MKKTMLLITAATLALSGGAAFSEDKPDCRGANAPDMLEGEVTHVDMGQGKLTLRARDGTTHEFEASQETLKDYKVGDPIKAKLRRDPRCN